MSDFNVDDVLERIKDCGRLTEAEIQMACEKAKELFLKESNILQMQAPITICGDIHGQFYDLKKLFEVGHDCPETNYLFLGDFVDRGYFSLETVLYVILLKLRYPDRIHIIRGNHESRQITQVYGFYEECLRKYQSSVVWGYLTDLFDYIPIGALIGNSILCLHGGLSPLISSLSQISSLNRFQEVPHEGAMCDLLWSDPEERPGWEGWNESPRGAGCLFGMDQVLKFNAANNLRCIVRAHQLAMEGYKRMFDDNLITVWSAPNYCYRCGNKASIMQVNENGDYEFLVFMAAEASKRKLPEKIDPPEYFL
ncbi:serine/threonine-protein phosphatase PP-X [Blastocystis sp. ATCC 50177/Nand II]|uniref:Serine/threonine-protein phosphatase n=1 Tax=Blastocystis sp. subtype 1 (strain ATCC 50177 / NandII) TaxID=478820 RepID=A0A196SIQ7_BLAHN|nr:serine/threonine-protein phosphatase PP-X [Blastocystis sp. ATCC 50177/Nand II]